MKNFLLVVILILLVTMTLSTPAKCDDKKIHYTTTDLKVDYDIIGVVNGFTTFDSKMFGDPFEGGLEDAWKDLDEKATKMGADAVIGVRIEFQNVTDKMVGRIIIYGTAVKVKAK